VIIFLTNRFYIFLILLAGRLCEEEQQFIDISHHIFIEFGSLSNIAKGEKKGKVL